VANCLEQGANHLHIYGPADATATPSSLALINPEWFAFLVLDYPGCPEKRLLNGCSSSSCITNATFVHTPVVFHP